MPCGTDPGACMKQGVVYRITCNICKQDGIQCDYIGESARTSYDRGQEHLEDLRKGEQSNALVMHMVEDHPEMDMADHQFAMKVVRFHKSNLARQAHEGQEIADYKGDRIMNRKGEWGSNLPPVLTVEDTNGRIRRDSNQPEGQPRTKRHREQNTEHPQAETGMQTDNPQTETGEHSCPDDPQTETGEHSCPDDNPQTDNPQTETGEHSCSDDPQTETGEHSCSDDNPQTETGEHSCNSEDPQTDNPQTETGEH